jgi:pSer/pThr/pTyr-binding forkhead associated (FHA) protein
MATGASRSPKESCQMDPRTLSDEVQSTGTLPVSGEALAAAAQDEPAERPGWVDESRATVDGPGRYLAYEEDGERIVVPIDRESTRIGRSLAADVRFDDATVSRRHALLVSHADGARVLDDRSLNGVSVNGQRVESSPLADGDRISVGRHTLWFLDTTGVSTAPAAAPFTTAE